MSAFSEPTVRGGEGRGGGASALVASVRAVAVFAAILSIAVSGVQPPGWSARVAVWLLGGGIAVAAVIRWGWVQYIPIYAANVLVDLLYRRALGPALVAELGLPAGVFVMVWLLERYGFQNDFERGRDMPLFIGAALVGMLVPAAVGYATLATWQPLDPMDLVPWTLSDLFRWWLNDFTGVLILGPLLVALRWKSLRPLIARPAASAVFLLLLAALVALILFGPWIWPEYPPLRAPALLGATVLVAAICWRFGLVPAAIAGLIVTATTVASLAFGVGILRGMHEVPGLVILWTYICAMSLPVLLITGLLAERRRQEWRYEQLFDACPQALWVHDETTRRFLVVNAAVERQYGYRRSELLQSTIETLAPAGEETRLDGQLAADAVQPIECRHRTRAGGIIFVEAWAQRIDFAGRPAWLVFAFDVSERKQLEGALVTAISGEQRRLGQELHDGLAQDLTVASILTGDLVAQCEERNLPVFPGFARLTERIASALENARNIAHGLSPLMSSNGDLAAALVLLAQASTVGETQVESIAHLESELRLPLEARTHLYRIAQEAVQNALKHAGAHRIEIRLTVRSPTVMLEVTDDGRGIARDESGALSFGLNTMRYRSSAIGGLLSIHPRPGGGTTVCCVAPQPSQSEPGSAHRAGLGMRAGGLTDTNSVA